MFDTTLQITGVEIAAEDGAAMLQILVGVGFGLPVGPGQVIPITAGRYRLPFDRDQSIQLSKALAEAADKLKRPSNLIVADTATAERAVSIDQQVRGG